MAPLADSASRILVGRVTTLEHGGKNLLAHQQLVHRRVRADSWRLSSRVTVNYGMRWEPYARPERRG